MPKYKVRTPLEHGYLDDNGENHLQPYKEGDEIELSQEEADPLLDAGTLEKGDSTRLEEAEERLEELQSEEDELNAKLLQAKQEVKDLRQQMRRDPDKEYATMVANPAVAPPKADVPYEDMSRQKLMHLARTRGLDSKGHKSQLVERLRANDGEGEEDSESQSESQEQD